MAWNLSFFINSILLGFALAMDAFSVSIANTLREKQMPFRRMCLMAGCYAFFQFLMPMTGWICVHTIVEHFTAFQKFIPWIALILLLYLGIKMIIEAVKSKENENTPEANDTTKNITLSILLLQGIATSIDALSVGFTIAECNLAQALCSSVIIAAVTFCVCMTGLTIGKKLGTNFSSKAEIAGGIILIGIGIQIFLKDILSH